MSDPNETRNAPRPTPGSSPRAGGKSRVAPNAVPGYVLVRELGRGGMGVVFEATQLSLGRTVALKMILADDLASERHVDRFRREARALARFQHPNVVQIIDFGEANGRPWYALEFCPGGSLADRLRGGPLPVSEAVGIVMTLADAVAAVHGEGILHRDLKPDNVLFSAKDAPKIADFGLVRDPEGAGTKSGATIGTPAYMAPEQARGERVVARADIYALGAILYECLTGRPPFEGPNAMSTLALVLAGRPPAPPRSRNPGVPAEIESVCLTALHPEATLRYQSAGELAAALGKLSRPAADPPLPRRPPKPRPEPAALKVARPPGESRLAAAVLAVLLVLGLGGLAVAAWLTLTRGVLPVAPTGPEPTWPARTIPEPTRPTPEPTRPTTRPAPLVAPFSVQQAAAGQAAWAAYLGRPVVESVPLEGGETMSMVLIPPGTFRMGSPRTEDGREEDESTYTVTISEPYSLGRTEVTQAQFKAVMNQSPSHFAPTGPGKGYVLGVKTDSLPVERVSWTMADDFCGRVGRKAQRAGSLPTEAQWEWACRAGSLERFCSGDSAADVLAFAWTTDNAGGRTHEVGGKKPNAFGVCDMHGNVFEWCLGGKYLYPTGKATDPVGPTLAGRRVCRGGCILFGTTSCRSANRDEYSQDFSYQDLGFRVVLAVGK